MTFFRGQGGMAALVALVLTTAGAAQANVVIGATKTGGNAGGIVVLPSPADGALIGGNNNMTVFAERLGSWSDGVNSYTDVVGVTALFRGATRDGALLPTDTTILGYLDFGNAQFRNEIVRVITQIPGLESSAAAVGVPAAQFLGPLGTSSFLFTDLPAGAGIEEVQNGDSWSLNADRSRFTFDFRATTVDSVRLLVRVTKNPIIVDPNVPGVPEPATWAMLIAGFGLVGATLRRRRGLVRSAC